MTKKFTFLLMALLALAGFKSWGQETKTLPVYPNGTDVHEQVPVITGWFDEIGTMTQFIIPSSDLAAITGGSISQLQFDISDEGTYSSIQNVQIKCCLKEVDNEVFSTPITSGLTEVFEGILSFTSTKMTVPFSSSFDYSGGNLLVSFEVTYSQANWYTGYKFYGKNTDYPSAYSNKYEPHTNNFLPRTTITYTGGSTCPPPTGLAASNITAEGATISWNDNGAESYNLDVNGTVNENVTNPYILDVELSTTYTVKVQAVCGEDETSAWSSAINFTTPDCWDGHTINYTLNDSYGDGWNGAYLTIVDSDDNTIETLTLSGRTESGSLTLCSGTYDFVWHKGSFDSECSFSISENEETLFTCYNASVYTDGQVVYTLDLLEKFSITLTQPGEEVGEISANPTENVAAGAPVTLNATPAFGYAFGEWTVLDAEENSVTLNSAVTVAENGFTMPESNVSVTATFTELTRYEINCATLTDGTIHAEYDGQTITTAPAGTMVTLVAEPNTGYALDHFTVDDETIAGNTFEMPAAAVSVSAVFKTVYTVTIDPNLVGGTITHTSTAGSLTAYPAGTQVFLGANPDTDYSFVENSFIVTRSDGQTGPTVTYENMMYSFIMPESNVTVSATFNKTAFAVSQVVTPMYSGSFAIDKTAHVETGETVTLSNFNAYNGYYFDFEDVNSLVVKRNDNQANVDVNNYGNIYQFAMPASDVTVTATFKVRPRYEVVIGSVTNGTVTFSYGEPDDHKYMSDETVYLEVNPASSDYTLASITATPSEGSAITPQPYYGGPTYYFTMPDFESEESTVTVTATFRELNTYTIKYYVNGELDRTMQCREDRFVNNDGPQNVAVPAGTTFEGWGVAEIGTYVTEKPAVLGNAEYPTQNYDLYAVLKYAEETPAAKGDDKWVEVTSPSDLKNNDQVIIVKKSSNVVMCDRSSAGSGNFEKATISISNNEITSLPSNAVILTAIDNGGNWKFSFTDAHTGPTTLADYMGGYLLPQNAWGGYDTWTIEQNGSSVALLDPQYNAYASFYSGYFTCVTYTYYKAELFKLYKPTITTNYYMTSVLTGGTVADATVKNIIVANPITVSGRLEMNAEGLFRNEDAANFVFADGAQFYYTGTENVKATFEKEIKAYQEATGNDGYYLIANPTNETAVANLTSNDFDLYTFDGAQEAEWRNAKEDDNFEVERGTGYLYANNETVTLEFAGELTPAGSTDVDLILAAAGEGRDFPGFNLIGNPFACNAYVGKSFYVIQGTELTLSENAYVAPCEGFFVEAESDGENLPISTSDPGLRGNSISLTVSQNRGNAIDRAIVSFDGRSNLHKFMLNPAHTNIRLAKNGEEFAALSSDAEGEIPVSFKAEKNGSYTITVNTENVEAQYLHLIDNMTGMDTDLLSTSSYTFNASTSDYAYRFKLVFNMNIDEANGSNANSFAYISNGNLVIDNIEGEATMQIVDMLGRVISTEIVSGSYNKALNLNAGLYIINLNGMTQKIVVK